MDMETRKIFTINLYDYLSLPKAEVCKEYQDHNMEIVDTPNSELTYNWEYERVDIDDQLESLINDSSCMINQLPDKYKYQMISDLVRYKYMVNNPTSVFIDTDLCIFDELGLEVIDKMSSLATKSSNDLLSGEINKNRLFPCNWLMIGSGKEDNIFKDMYNLLTERLKTDFYKSYTSSGKWSDKMEDYIWVNLWGYSIPQALDIRKFSLIPYEYFQAYSWNGNWKTADVMKPRNIVGCHFFGFAESRPKWNEFVEYHKLSKYNE